ncbi:MAG: lamin tail domain-containing protein [Anaerolineales bacterium]|nr:lamin tail domain-containing protein [Anaerolineales bacterium]
MTKILRQRFILIFLFCTTMMITVWGTNRATAAELVVITEIAAVDGANAMMDEDGDFSDWVEIHNPSHQSLDLNGWYLTDDPLTLTQWQLPSIIVPPNGYLLVFASGKDRLNGELHTNFRLSSDGEYLALVEPDGMTVAWGYGPTFPQQYDRLSYGLDANLNPRYFTTPTPGTANYTQSGNLTPIVEAAAHVPALPTADDTITITTTVSASSAAVGGVYVRYQIGGSPAVNRAMFDDGLHGDGAAGDGVYGYTIPANTFQTADVISYYIRAENIYGYYTRWPLLESELPDPIIFIVQDGYTPPDLVINEVSALSLGWIELYNPSIDPIDLSGFYLTNSLINNRQWMIPLGTTIAAGDHLLFWPDETDTNRHTNFELDDDGGTVGLFDPAGFVIDSVTYPDQRPYISYARATDGGDSWVHAEPTYGSSNNGAAQVENFLLIAPEPAFSILGGFYPSAQSVSLTVPDSSQIRYTTDGTIPTSQSTLFNSSIAITQTTVLRARAFAAGVLPGPVASQTFLINAATDLPVISLATDPIHLFDDNIGIYVEGSDGVDGRCLNSPFNWNQNWERPLSFELYEPDGSNSIQVEAGLKIFGNCSRRFTRKSVSITMRDRYETDVLNYKLFEDKELDQFSTFILRNSGGRDWNQTIARDATMQSLLEGRMDIDQQSYRPAVVYINGEYWGIFNIREKMDDTFIYDQYGYDKDDIDLLERNATVKEGSADHYNALINFMKNNDLNVPANYEYVQTQMEVGEFMNYMLSEIYFGDTDWPGNNIRLWRPQTPDGRWRWMLYDVDFGYGGYGFDAGTANDPRALPSHDTFDWAYDRLEIFRLLLTSQYFTDEFMQRFASHLNITFDETRALSVVNEVHDGIVSEMPNHIFTWGTNTGNLPPSYPLPLPTVDRNFPAAPVDMPAWEEDFDVMRNYAVERPCHMFNHLNLYLTGATYDTNNCTLNGTLTLTVTVAPPAGGTVLVNEVDIRTDQYSGDYFANLPIRLTAVPAVGYRFVGWQQAGQPDNPALEISVPFTQDVSLTAVFEELPAVVINEIHYHAADAQGLDEDYEFVELYNPGSVAIDLADYQFSSGIAYTFTGGTSIAAGEYIVIASNPATYSGLGGQVFGWVDGRLDNGGETLTLLNGEGFVVDTVSYDDEGGWPTTPDGLGPSLSLIDADLDNALPTSWEASAATGGTPGQANNAADFLQAASPLAVTVQTTAATATGRSYLAVMLLFMILGGVTLTAVKRFAPLRKR